MTAATAEVAALPAGWWPSALPALAAASAVLQTPCGRGAWLLGVTGEALIRVGADPIQANLSAAREAGALRGVACGFVPAVSWSLPFADRAFALVVSAGALECAPDPLRALVELVRLLGEGGWLVVAWPLGSPAPGGDEDDALHYPALRRVDAAALRAWCADVGLEVAQAGDEAGLGWGMVGPPHGSSR